jgi:hypothetical protein
MDDMSPLMKWTIAIATLVMLILACWRIRVRMARRSVEQDTLPRN